MQKTLIYHLYCDDDFETNYANFVHKRCLQHYIGLFDEVRFTIAVDDLSNDALIKKGIEWIFDLGHTGKKDIRIVENGEYFEVGTFKSEILDSADKLDGAVFFAHNKASTNMVKDGTVNESILKWVIGMYFYNLEFVDEVEGFFTGKTRAPEVFYGAFLSYFTKERTSMVHAMPNNHSGLEYAGTFYWINMPKYRNSVKCGIIKTTEPDSRFFAEEFPGMFFERYAYGCGMTSHNDAIFDATEITFYNLSKRGWDYAISVLGDGDKFIEFINQIKQ